MAANPFITHRLGAELQPWEVNGKMKLSNFIKKIDVLKLASGASDQDVICFAVSKLADNDTFVFASSILDDQENTGYDWLAFKTALVEQFDEPADDWVIEGKLSQLYRSDSETMDQYGIRFSNGSRIEFE